MTLGKTRIPQCMPDEYKDKESSITAYRNYYLGEKKYMAKWTKRHKPIWWDAQL